MFFDLGPSLSNEQISARLQEIPTAQVQALGQLLRSSWMNAIQDGRFVPKDTDAADFRAFRSGAESACYETFAEVMRRCGAEIVS